MIGKFRILLGMVSMLLFVSCVKNSIEPSSEMVTKKYDIRNIENITVISGGVVVFYTQSDTISVNAEGPANMVERLRIKEVHGNKLWVELGNCDQYHITSDSQLVKIRISSPEISSIKTMGAASVVVPGRVNEPKLIIETFENSTAHFSTIDSRYVVIRAFQHSEITIDSLNTSRLNVAPYNDATIIIAGKTIYPIY